MQLVSEARFALRVLRRSPLYATVTVVALAIGIAAKARIGDPCELETA